MCGSVLEREITMQDLLKIISDPERVKLGNIEDKYLSDTLGRLKGTAAALVFPKSTEEVSAVMKFANDRGLPRNSPRRGNQPCRLDRSPWRGHNP